MMIRMVLYCVSGSRGLIFATYMYLLKQHSFYADTLYYTYIAVLCMLYIVLSLSEKANCLEASKP